MFSLLADTRFCGAGRLLQVVDSATSLTENYVWNADGTLASYPGPGYTRLLEYDEEGRLVRIKRNTGGTITTAYEYGYGYDGGKRWRKDYLQNQWTWYPCGVACSAGELVEQQSDLTGATWTTTVTYLRTNHLCSSAKSMLIQSSSFTPHFSLSGTADVITNSQGVATNIGAYDYFGVQRYDNSTPNLQWIRSFDEGYHLSNRISSISNRVMPGFRGVIALQNQAPQLNFPSYGLHCGPTASSLLPGIDCIDKACAKHDTCLATWVQFIIPYNRYLCDCALMFAALNCLFKGGCATSPTPGKCQIASGVIASFMCTNGTILIAGCCGGISVL